MRVNRRNKVRSHTKRRTSKSRSVPTSQRGQDARELGTRERLLQVASDMRRDPSLSFYRAATGRGVSPKSRHVHLKNLFYRASDGRIRPRKSDRYCETLFVPTTQPGVYAEIHTKNSRERSIVGEWLAAINAAARGGFSAISAFPRNQVFGGVRLPTSPDEVQRIVEAMAESDDRYEGPYLGRTVRA